MNHFLVVDAALRKISDKPMAEALRPDFTVAFYCQMFRNVCHVRECLAGRWNSPDTGMYLARWSAERFQGCPIFIEAINFPDLADTIKRHAKYIEVTEIRDPRDNAKLLRQQELQTAIQAGLIVVDLSQHSDEFRVLDAQLRAFPQQFKGRDDFRDALSLILLALDAPAANPPSSSGNGGQPTYLGTPSQRRAAQERDRQNDDTGSTGLVF